MTDDTKTTDGQLGEAQPPTDEKIARYRTKYGPPVPPTDLGKPEDPESFRALARPV